MTKHYCVEVSEKLHRTIFRVLVHIKPKLHIFGQISLKHAAGLLWSTYQKPWSSSSPSVRSRLERCTQHRCCWWNRELRGSRVGVQERCSAKRGRWQTLVVGILVGSRLMSRRARAEAARDSRSLPFWLDQATRPKAKGFTSCSNEILIIKCSINTFRKGGLTGQGWARGIEDGKGFVRWPIASGMTAHCGGMWSSFCVPTSLLLRSTWESKGSKIEQSEVWCTAVQPRPWCVAKRVDCGGLWYLPSLVAGISRSPRQVDSRFILILVVDVVTAPGVTADGDLTVLLLVELEATARDDDWLEIILTGDSACTSDSYVFVVTCPLCVVGFDGWWKRKTILRARLLSVLIYTPALFSSDLTGDRAVMKSSCYTLLSYSITCFSQSLFSSLLAVVIKIL